MQFVDLSQEPSRLFRMLQLLLTGHEAIENPGGIPERQLIIWNTRKDKQNPPLFLW